MEIHVDGVQGGGYIRSSVANSQLRGRHGFDGNGDFESACRGPDTSLILGNTSNANDHSYALAA